MNKVLSLYILITIVCGAFFQCTSFPQHAEIKEYGYKGNVKSVTTYHYSLIHKTGDQWIPIDTNRYHGLNTRYFNCQGNIDSTIFEYNYANHKNYSTFRLTSKLINYFDTKGAKRNSLYTIRYDHNSDDITSDQQFYTYEWINDHEYIERVYNRDGIQLNSKNHYHLNKNYRDFKCEYTAYSVNDSMILHSSYINEISPENLLIKSTETNLITKEINITRYEYKKSDLLGNPTIIYVYRDENTEPVMVTLRTYTYY
jgi:hypothetical protein